MNQNLNVFLNIRWPMSWGPTCLTIIMSVSIGQCQPMLDHNIAECPVPLSNNSFDLPGHIYGYQNVILVRY